MIQPLLATREKAGVSGHLPTAGEQQQNLYHELRSSMIGSASKPRDPTGVNRGAASSVGGKTDD